jgi:hypothetical protein
MVQDNYFFPGNPQQLALKRPNIPAIIGNCKDEYAGWGKKYKFAGSKSFLDPSKNFYFTASRIY